MCGDRSHEKQHPFYYYVVQGPSGDESESTQLWWLNSLRTAYSNLFDIWAAQPPCSGECLIMGGASDAWVTYGHSTARSVYFQLRAFAAFDPHALPRACGEKGVMLRFGGMTINGSVVSCYGQDDWGQTGASCPFMSMISDDFNTVVTQPNDDSFFEQAGKLSEIRLETESSIVTVSPASGVQIREKDVCNAARPTLNIPWRCSEQGGVSDRSMCPSPEPAACTVAPPNNGGCCSDCPTKYYCPANKGCYEAGQDGCEGGYCPAPKSSTSIVV